MADEEKNEQETPEGEEVTEAPEAAAEQAPEGEDGPRAAADEAAEAPEAEQADEPAADAEPEEAPEPAAPEPAAPAAADASDEAEPEEQLSPKQARKRARSEHSGEPAEQRSAEQRAGEREEQRKAKIASRSRYRKARRAKKGEARTGTPPAERPPGTKKQQQGIVTSARADKTITVRVESARRHPSYEKIVRRSKSLHAHDENNDAGEGDTVRVIETRPMSKSKRWRLVEVVEKAR